MRARAETAREWEAEAAGPEFFGCKGMGAQRAAWAAAFDAEAAKARGHDHVATLLDLVKAFEMIPHKQLVEAARATGFSLRVLRMSLAAYRIARTVGVDGVYSETVTATRGITAGSGLATTELRVLLTETIFLLRKTWPVALKLYVDDLTIAASGRGEDIAKEVAAATDAAVQAFGKLGLEISVKKSLAVASRPKVLATMMHWCKSRITAVGSAKLLGTSFAAGARRTVDTLRARILRVKKIAHRAQQLARLGLSAVEYVRGAAVPAMLYGCETAGVANTMLDDACTVAAAALAPPTAGKDPVMVLHAAATHTHDVNPTMAAHVGPIKTWATAWWDGWADKQTMSDTYTASSKKVNRAGTDSWNVVNGPAAALAATLRRLKWRSNDGRVFHDDVGNQLDVNLDSPKAFANAARRSVVRYNTDKAMTHLPPAEPKTADVNSHSTFAAANARAGGRRHVLVDLTSFVRPLYKGSKKVTTMLPQWTAKCRGYLTSAINGGQWPQARKAKLPNFEASNQCQLCHSATGTLRHRHSCSVTRPAQGWTEHTQETKRFLESISEDRQHALTTRGVLTVRIPIPDPQTPSPG